MSLTTDSRISLVLVTSCKTTLIDCVSTAAAALPRTAPDGLDPVDGRATGFAAGVGTEFLPGSILMVSSALVSCSGRVVEAPADNLLVNF